MNYAFKRIKKAAKKAKTFEIQKLIKRLKEHCSDHEGCQDLETLESLKNVDHEIIAIGALRTKLNKIRMLSENPEIQKFISTVLSPNSNHSLLAPERDQVLNRLLSSKILSKEINGFLNGLKTFLLPSAEVCGDELETWRAKRSQKVEGEEICKARKMDREVCEAQDWESPSSEEMISHSSEPRTAVKVSTFLPSLSVGFAPGSVGSDLSENETNVADIEIKKNRRGQRARRLIWEKKYGKNANHKRQEVESRVGRGIARRQGVYPNKKSSGPGETVVPSGCRMAEDVDKAKLHPSWEAKRRLKEKEKTSIVPSEGKKTVFS